MADAPMSQDDIDKLLASMSDEPAPAGTPASPPAPTPAAAPTAQPVVEQDELDLLIKALEGNDDISPSAAAPAANAAPPSGPLGQDDIDNILASLDAGAATTPPAAQAPAAAPPAPAGPLGQDDIDALLANMTGGGDAAASPPAPAPPAAPAGPLGQDDIDALLAQMGSAEPPSAPAKPPTKPATKPAANPAAAGDKGLGQDDIDALLAQMGSGDAGTQQTAGASDVTLAAPQTPPEDAGLDQAGIDALLAQMGDAGGAPAAEPPPAVPGAGAPGTGRMALSTEDLTALVSKHAAPSSGSDTQESMIDQSDIDALVHQLGAATGATDSPGASKGSGKPGSRNHDGPPTVVTAPTISQELARHDAAIDQLLGQQPSHPPRPSEGATMDAIDFKAMMRGPGTPPGTLPPGVTPTYNVTVPVLTPPELRGARWLLAAAVLLLAICSGTLITVSIHLRTLGSELARERAAELTPSEEYATDFTAAIGRLASPDQEQAAKGVSFLQKLKKRFPSHESEIALALARHFRDHGAWKEAAREYAGALDDPHASDDDPRILLEHADTLRQLGNHEGAKRVLYQLLANESRWTDPNATRPAAVTERNRRALVDAQLLLARLFDDGREPAVAAVSASEPHGAAPAEPAAHGEGGHH